MGAIFEAEHLATERRVALKLLFPHIMSVASARQKFELEAKVSARVNSPYIVEVLDAGFDEASKSPYLVMELLEGQTLAARVREHGPLPVDEALRLLEQVSAGLDAAHGYKEAGGAPKPIVHRDLKPENLFLARQHDGSVVAKILDYGIAKVLGDTTHISQEVRGTPLFMAFEQITAGVLSPQTDVWAFGLIAYYILTGARYWRSAERQGASVQSLFAEILTLPLDAPSLRLREQNSDIALPPAFDAWLLRCIDREPSQRFPSAGAAIEALGRIYERAPRAAARPAAPSARPGERTQTFFAADPASAAAAAPPSPAAVPAAAVGSVPALSATKHRRSFPASVMSSPLHWAAVGAAGGVLVLGGVVWLVTRDAAPARDVPAASEPSSSVQAARPAQEAVATPSRRPSNEAAAASPTAAPGGEAPGAASTAHPSAAAATPRIRVAPLDETLPAGTGGAGAPEPAAADNASDSARLGSAAGGATAPSVAAGASGSGAAVHTGSSEARMGAVSVRAGSQHAAPPEAARSATAGSTTAGSATASAARSSAQNPAAPSGPGPAPAASGGARVVTVAPVTPPGGSAGSGSAAGATPEAPTAPRATPKRPRKPSGSEAYKTR